MIREGKGRERKARGEEGGWHMITGGVVGVCICLMYVSWTGKGWGGNNRLFDGRMNR